MEKVRIGIIGMGRMGLTHYSIINTHPAVEMTAIADIRTVKVPVVSDMDFMMVSELIIKKSFLPCLFFKREVIDASATAGEKPSFVLTIIDEI